jgi:putative FmdB family regulatory protein
VLSGNASRLVDAVQFHVRGFVGCRVLPGGFSERRAVGGRIENVVDDLESESQPTSSLTQGREFIFLRPADESAHHERGFDHGGGFVQMNELEFVRGRIGLFFRQQIFHLTSDQATAAGGVGQFVNQRVSKLCVRCVRGGQKREGVGEQGVTGQQRGRFIECLVRRRTAPAQVVVVHARQVVVDQRIRVHAFDGDGRWKGEVFWRTEGFRHGEDEDRTKAFTAGFQAVAHGGVQPGRTRFLGRNVAIEAAFDLGNEAFEFGRKVHRKARVALASGCPSKKKFAKNREVESSLAKTDQHSHNANESDMPTYEYACTKCGYEFEQFQSMKDEPLKKCPKCKKPALKRLVGGGAGLIFKGTGFYITDYKNKSSGGGEKTGGGGETKSSDTKPASDSKPATETKASSTPASGDKSSSGSKKK